MLKYSIDLTRFPKDSLRSGSHILHCPLCGAYIHHWHPDDRIPGDSERVMADSEAAAHAHFAANHRLRYRLWTRLRWSRILSGGLG